MGFQINTGMLTKYINEQEETEVVIPDNVTKIGERVFTDCKFLEKVTILNSVTEIGWITFMGCKSLTSVTIPDSVKEIDNKAFKECTSLNIYSFRLYDRQQESGLGNY